MLWHCRRVAPVGVGCWGGILKQHQRCKGFLYSTRNKGITTSSQKLLMASASLLVAKGQRALLLGTRNYYNNLGRRRRLSSVFGSTPSRMCCWIEMLRSWASSECTMQKKTKNGQKLRNKYGSFENPVSQWVHHLICSAAIYIYITI